MNDRDGFYKQVGERIRARRGKKLSQDALALAVGLTRSSISNIEKGRQKLLLHTLVDIANALNVDAAALLPGAPGVQAADVGKLPHLTDNERVFVESAIRIAQTAQKEEHGSQEEENSGNGGRPASRVEHHRSARARVGDRTEKGRADRRRLSRR